METQLVARRGCGQALCRTGTRPRQAGRWMPQPQVDLVSWRSICEPIRDGVGGVAGSWGCGWKLLSAFGMDSSRSSSLHTLLPARCRRHGRLLMTHSLRVIVWLNLLEAAQRRTSGIDFQLKSDLPILSKHWNYNFNINRKPFFTYLLSRQLTHYQQQPTRSIQNIHCFRL